MSITGYLRDKLQDKIRLSKGDALQLTYTDEHDVEQYKKTFEIEQDVVVTHAGIFTFEDEFGLDNGIGGFFGEEK